MLSLVNAISPPPMKTSKHKRMIGRRLNPNARRPLSIGYVSIPHEIGLQMPTRRGGQSVAEEQRPLRGDQLAGLHALEDLPIALLLKPDLDQAAAKAPAVGGDPHRHGAVALPHHAV